jgi:hypothetical protein
MLARGSEPGVVVACHSGSVCTFLLWNEPFQKRNVLFRRDQQARRFEWMATNRCLA